MASASDSLEQVKALIADRPNESDPLIEPVRKLVISYEHLRRSYTTTVNTSESYQEKLRELNAELDKAMRTDFLTGLMNRRAFYDRINAELSRSKRHKRPLCIILADVDKFKSVNDKYGHGIGDAVLKVVAQAFVENLRTEDLRVRWGGEEFLAMLPETDARGAVSAAEKLREWIEAKEIQASGVSLKVTMSLGVAEKADKTIDDAIREADQALYQAKESGRNRVMLYTPGASSSAS